MKGATADARISAIVQTIREEWQDDMPMDVLVIHFVHTITDLEREANEELAEAKEKLETAYERITELQEALDLAMEVP